MPDKPERYHKEVMLKLPNLGSVQIEREKVADYLLNPRHPDAAGKASFFTAQGFTVEAWEVFADALRRLAASGPLTRHMDSRHGTKYIVDGPLATPVGKTPRVRTIWIVDQGANHPRLVTAYPYKGGD